MITEDYVSFETAKLLKEKGFDLSEFHGKWAIDYDNIPRDENTSEGEIIIAEWHYPLITLQMAMKWLREVHNIDINIYAESISHKKRYTISIWKNIQKDDAINDVILGVSTIYEEACEAAIKYCLENLI